MFGEVCFFGYVDLEAAYLVNLKSWWLYDLVVKENMFNVLSNRYIMVQKYFREMATFFTYQARLLEGIQLDSPLTG